MCSFLQNILRFKNKISYDGASFGNLDHQTEYDHYTGELARYNGSPVAIAGNGVKKVEIFQSGSWADVDDYPARYFLKLEIVSKIVRKLNFYISALEYTIWLVYHRNRELSALAVLRIRRLPIKSPNTHLPSVSK